MRAAQPEALERQVEQWLIKLFGADHAVVRHLRRTLYWLERLYPDAGPALRLAALCHDVQRAEEVGDGGPGVPAALTGAAYLAHHQHQGARMATRFLVAAGAEESLVRRVAAYVARHEEGGGAAGDALLDADSVSFFENSVDFLLTAPGRAPSTAGLREKFAWMFGRIRSAHARDLARPLYEQALERLAE